MAAPELVEAVRVIEAELERDLFQLLSFIVQPVRCAQERDINVVLCGHACNFLHAFAQVIRTYVKRIGTLLHAVEPALVICQQIQKASGNSTDSFHSGGIENTGMCVSEDCAL